MLLEESINLPVKLLLSRNYIENDIIDISKLPESLYLIRNYNSFLENNYNETLNKIPKTTKDLCEMMLLNKNLGGEYKLVNEEIIVWTFDEVMYEIAIDEKEGYFRVLKNNKFKLEITHWHPDEFEIYDDICKIGEKGNVLIIKTFLGSAYILYMGPKEKCNFKINKKSLYKIYYFESE